MAGMGFRVAKQRTHQWHSVDSANNARGQPQGNDGSTSIYEDRGLVLYSIPLHVKTRCPDLLGAHKANHGIWIEHVSTDVKKSNLLQRLAETHKTLVPSPLQLWQQPVRQIWTILGLIPMKFTSHKSEFG